MSSLLSNPPGLKQIKMENESAAEKKLNRISLKKKGNQSIGIFSNCLYSGRSEERKGFILINFNNKEKKKNGL